VTAPSTRTTGITATDQAGNNLVFERWPDGHITSWSLDSRDRETLSVRLSDLDRQQIAAFLLDGLP
jgi:hypothetical protein